MFYLFCKVALEIIIYSSFFFVSKCSYAHLLDCILTDPVGLCIFSVIKNIWLGVAIINVETWTHLFLERLNSHFRRAPTLGNVSGALPNTGNVGNSHLSHLVFQQLMSVQSSPLFSCRALWFALGTSGLAEELGTEEHPWHSSEACTEAFGVIQDVQDSQEICMVVWQMSSGDLHISRCLRWPCLHVRG